MPTGANTKARKNGVCTSCKTTVDAGNKVRYIDGKYAGCQWCDYGALPVDQAQAAARKAGWLVVA